MILSTECLMELREMNPRELIEAIAEAKYGHFLNVYGQYPDEAEIAEYFIEKLIRVIYQRDGFVSDHR